jgi:hypothetical protein
MRKFTLPLMAFGAMVVSGLYVSPASAQATRTWVSGVGDDFNPCSRTAPCKTFSGAISKTQAGGEINCLDPGGFGALTITKSITVSCEIGTGGVVVSGTNAIIVNAAATDRVMLKGLDIEGLGTGLAGIRFLSGAALHVTDTVIRGFNSASSGHGIQFAPVATASLFVHNTTIFQTGNGTSGTAIQIRPTGGATSALITNLNANRGTFGIAADGGGGAASIAVTIRDSAINGFTQTAILSTSAGAGVGVMVHSSSSTNSGTGVSATGAGAALRIGSSVVSGNTTGVSGAGVTSYKNNQIDGNGNNGTPVPQVNLN